MALGMGDAASFFALQHPTFLEENLTARKPASNFIQVTAHAWFSTKASYHGKGLASSVLRCNIAPQPHLASAKDASAARKGHHAPPPTPAIRPRRSPRERGPEARPPPRPFPPDLADRPGARRRER